MKEHMTVRTGVGLFDVSHMGEIELKGEDALHNLQKLLTNDFTNMADGQARYSVMCYDSGGAVDDLIVYKRGTNDYFIVVNAANKDKDYAWMKQHEFGNAAFTDVSSTIGQIAIQGPLSKKVMEKAVNPEMLPEKYYHANFYAEIKGIKCIISQTGYTGEMGYEIYMPANEAVNVWNILMEAGKEENILPCGLGARDTLRLEAAMPLYGHEMDETIHPLEVGLNFAVKMNKPDFIGKKSIEEKGIRVKRIGLKVTGKGIVREHMDLYCDGKLVGKTTSGTFAPYLGYAIAMALVDSQYAIEGKVFQADVRGRMTECEAVSLPFYKREKASL
jgi:aminomethyltransferase